MTKDKKKEKEINRWVEYIFDDNAPMECNENTLKEAKKLSSYYIKYKKKNGIY